MEKHIFYTDFRSLKQSYLEVKSFLEKETAEEVDTLKSTVANDLGCSGDDNWDLLTKFVTKYNLNTEGFVYSDHFLSEGELYNSGTALWWLICTSILMILYIIKLLTFGKLDWTKTNFASYELRRCSDLTFGDLLAWYLTGNYCLRGSVEIRFKNAV